MNALQPGTALIAKVASILVHVEEGSSKGGHHWDWVAVQNLIADAEVQEWLKALGAMSLVPVKRGNEPSRRALPSQERGK